MSEKRKFGEPWRFDDMWPGRVYEGDLVLLFAPASQDEQVCELSPFELERVVVEHNALAGVEHPEKLGDLLAACKVLYDESTVGIEIWRVNQQLSAFVAAYAAFTGEGAGR